MLLSATLMMGCTPWGAVGFRELLCGRNRLDNNRFHFINTRALVTAQGRRRRISGHFVSSVGETKGGEAFIIKDEKMEQHDVKQSSDAVRSSVRLKICYTDHGEEILSERGEIFFKGASTKQATLEWKEPPRRALLLVKVQ